MWYIIIFDDDFNIKHVFKTEFFPYLDQIAAVLKDLEDLYESNEIKKLKLNIIDSQTYTNILKENKGKK